MNDDELKKLWQQQPLRKPDVSPEQLISAMHKQTSQLRRTLLARDVRELLACVIVGVIFGIYFFIFRAPFMRAGDFDHRCRLDIHRVEILRTRRTTAGGET